jgi:O-succinylbenzoate synthase
LKIAALDFRRYQRPFDPPLRTAAGRWEARTGFLLRVTDTAGRQGFGEAAPLPAFGTESSDEAEACLRRWRAAPARASVPGPEAGLPCCAFALSAALRAATPPPGPGRDYEVAGLLPAGEGASARLGELAGRGFRTFKWKMGILRPREEQDLFERLESALPAGGRLRLDFNGGLGADGLRSWLRFLEGRRETVEFIEQPLPSGREDEAAAAARSAPVPLALDESVHRPGGLRWLAPGAWPGPLVLKPALLGDAGTLAGLLGERGEPVVFSSAFETDVGQRAVLALAEECDLATRALGFNTSAYFNDRLNRLPAGPILPAGALRSCAPVDLWNELPPSN